MLKHLKEQRFFWKHLLFLAFLFAISWLVKSFSFEENSPRINRFQTTFSQQERALNQFSDEISSQLKRGVSPQNVIIKQKDSPFYIHIYRNDSLLFWNTNQLPISRFVDLHFPVKGLVELQNGWYYSIVKRVQSFSVVVSFGIQQKFPYQNKELKTHFFKPFQSFSAELRTDAIATPAIRNNSGETIFRLSFDAQKSNNGAGLMVLFFLVIVTIITIWDVLRNVFSSYRGHLLLLFLTIAARFCLLESSYFDWITETPLGDARLFAFNDWIPNLAELIIWMLFSVFFGVHIRHLTAVKAISSYFTFLGILISPILLLVFPHILKALVDNSSVPLQLNRILELNLFSILVLLIIGIFGGAFVFVSWKVISNWKMARLSRSIKTTTFLATSLFFTIIILFFSEKMVLQMSLLLFVIGVIVWMIYKTDRHFSFAKGMVLIVVMSTAIGISIQTDVIVKERLNREVYANQLADEQDISTELEFEKIEPQLLSESYLNRLSSTENQPRFTELKDALERRVFNGFWERYDCDFYYWISNGIPSRFNGIRESDLQDLILQHGIRSELDSNLFFIQDYTSQFTYVFREKLTFVDTNVMLYGTLKSKRIPEKIGFPRLLISDKANVFETLSGYSIAKFHKGKLASSYGEFSYPRVLNDFVNRQKQTKFWQETSGWNHFVLQKTPKDCIVFSKSNHTILDWFTMISLLVVLYLCVTVPIIILFYWKKISFSSLSLASKIQLVMIALLVVSLVGFSAGSGAFVSNQYADYTQQLIRDKINAVRQEARLNWQNNIAFSSIDRSEFEFDLLNWSKIFVADLNLYDVSGHLIASSRPKVFNYGLMSEQMNSTAFNKMRVQNLSECLQTEHIGELNYLSAYLPLLSKEGDVLGFINLQHFDQQNVYESQLQRFIVSIVDVFLVLLVLSIAGAVAVSSWLTGPLRILKKGFSTIQLGKNNQRIVYDSKDEIGALIDEYNSKLDELEKAVQLLGQSERESAWREMAKQVAHEIKNPLTPMKLSIQHLQRVFDPADPQAKEKINRVAEGVIEQINALTTIANTFSNFAKMPQPLFEHINLIELVQSVVQFFQSSENILIVVQTDLEEVWVNADKELLLRVMNNLITNAVQSVEFDQKVLIEVSVLKLGNSIEIRLKDNGLGIPSDQIETIFEPYFTTKSTGTGLGLSMVKQIIESHEGTISIESTGSSGTVVCIVLPAVLT